MTAGPEFIGVSTGRSGSMYTAGLFTAAGLPTSHEQHYRADRYDDVGALPWQPPAPGVLGEWSAQAVPELPLILAGDPGPWLFHQVRDPIKVIGSYLNFGLFDRLNRLGLQGAYMRDKAGIEGHDPLTEAVRFYVQWNDAIEAAAGPRYMRWRVEDMSAELVMSVGELVGCPLDRAQVWSAVEHWPQNVNSRHTAHRVTWADLDNSRRVDQFAAGRLRDMAERYGYDV